MSVAITNSIYNPQINPQLLYNSLRDNNKLGFLLSYDPESNQISLRADMPKPNDYIELIMPYDFDINFFTPQFIELNYFSNNIKNINYIMANNIRDMIQEVKKIIIFKIFEDKYYGINNLEILEEKDKMLGDFIFYNNNGIMFFGLINFINGNVNISAVPST